MTCSIVMQVFFMHCGFAMVCPKSEIHISIYGFLFYCCAIPDPHLMNLSHGPSCMQISIGCVRTRFAKSIAILILVDAAASAVGYYLTGYAFAFGDNTDGAGVANGNYFIGMSSCHACCAYAPSQSIHLTPELPMQLLMLTPLRSLKSADHMSGCRHKLLCSTRAGP